MTMNIHFSGRDNICYYFLGEGIYSGVGSRTKPVERRERSAKTCFGINYLNFGFKTIYFMIRIVTIRFCFVPSGRVGEEKEATGKNDFATTSYYEFLYFFLEHMCCVLVRLQLLLIYMVAVF